MVECLDNVQQSIYAVDIKISTCFIWGNLMCRKAMNALAGNQNFTNAKFSTSITIV